MKEEVKNSLMKAIKDDFNSCIRAMLIRAPEKSPISEGRGLEILETVKNLGFEDEYIRMKTILSAHGLEVKGTYYTENKEYFINTKTETNG